MAIPIPARPSGYRLGQADAPIVIEMFLDLECPFSNRGWQNVMPVTHAYSPEQVCWIFQLMTLGNHRQSWDATKATLAFADGDTDRFIRFVSYVFNHQSMFANEAWKDKTQTDFHRLLADFAADVGSVDKETFIQQINSDEVYAQARIPARFATVRGVWSTPTFFINGAEATQLSSSAGLSDWKAVIDDLL